MQARDVLNLEPHSGFKSQQIKRICAQELGATYYRALKITILCLIAQIKNVLQNILCIVSVVTKIDDLATLVTGTSRAITSEPV